MPRAEVCVDVDTPEQAVVEAWVERWRGQVPYLSENEGCGCCVDLYRIDAPQHALDELPPKVFAVSVWANAAP